MIIDTLIQIMTILLLVCAAVFCILGYKNYSSLNSNRSEVKRDNPSNNVSLDANLTTYLSKHLGFFYISNVRRMSKQTSARSRIPLINPSENYTLINQVRSVKGFEFDRLQKTHHQVHAAVIDLESTERYKILLHRREKTKSRRANEFHPKINHPFKPSTIQ